MNELIAPPGSLGLVLISLRERTLGDSWVGWLRAAGFDARMSGGDWTGATPLVVIRDADSAEVFANLSWADRKEAGPCLALVVSASDHRAQVPSKGQEGTTLLPRDLGVEELVRVCSLLAKVSKWRSLALRERKNRRKLTRIALADPLTGLPNRRAWERETRRLSREHRSEADRVCLAIFDLDQFKETNDRLGHLIGDHVLRSAADTLRRNLRPTDFLARVGGDEFALLGRYSATDEHVMTATFERLRRAIEETTSSDAQARVSASVGVAWTAPKTHGPKILGYDQGFFLALVSLADDALRRAKKAGGARVVVAGSTKILDRRNGPSFNGDPSGSLP